MKKGLLCLIALLNMVVSSQVFSQEQSQLKCEIWVARNTCWKDFDVSVNMIDYANLKPVTTIKFPKLTSETPKDSDFFVKKEFDCNSVDVITFNSRFSPAIWKGTDKETYNGRKVWSVPKTLKKKVEWHVSVCFSDDFVGVPTPIRGQKDCRCLYPKAVSSS